jgi:hypothetical protein
VTYGLEFMGKSWDRLDDVGQTSHAGWQDGQPDKYDYPMQRRTSKHASYSGSSNVKCRACGKWQWAPKETKCVCESPDFPNVKAHQARSMQSWHETWAREAFRVLKPGGHLLAFSGTRTSHRMVCAIEDAGFEIRDSIVWLYGSGFPKSRSLRDIGRPELGTALKPAHEPICVARKPLVGTVARNVAAWGTGAINVDATRIGFRDETDQRTVQDATWYAVPNDVYGKYEAQHTRQIMAGKDSTPDQGRWPANVVLSHHEDCVQVGTKRVKAGRTGVGDTNPPVVAYSDGLNKSRSVPRTPDGTETVTAWECHPDCAVHLLDATVGERKGAVSNGRKGKPQATCYGDRGEQPQLPAYGDTGGPSRFFKVIDADEDEPIHWINPAYANDPFEPLPPIEEHYGEPVDNVTQDSEAGIIDARERPDQSQNDPTDATSPPRDIYAATSAEECECSTSLSGSSITVPSQTDTKSTTSTKTSRTTASRTLNSEPRPTTSASTAAANGETDSGSNNVRSVVGSVQSTPRTGISASRDIHSTADVEPAMLPGSLPINSDGGLRFGYHAKASRRERNAGLPDGMTNVHPTVKSVSLMRWLVRLVTPPGGLVLDPFCGSGSTGCAAVLEGFQFVGIEQSEEYATIARARIAYWAERGDKPIKGDWRGGANATVSYGRMRKRECRVCGNKTNSEGRGGKWPNCDHDDWTWVEQVATKHPTVFQPALELEGVAD